jgi:hypothetical protein
MDKAILQEHLEMAQRHVAEGQRHVEEQRARALELESHGHDTTEALRLLGEFEELLELHRQDRDRLLKELKE